MTPMLGLGLFGRGGLNRMEPSDFEQLGDLVAKHFGFLSGFADDIEAGDLSEDAIGSRAALYVGSGIAAYEQGAAAASGVDLPVYPTEGTHPACRCSWSLDPRDDGSTDAYWIAADDACEECSSLAEEYNPLVIEQDLVTS